MNLTLDRPSSRTTLIGTAKLLLLPAACGGER
jgi:hypothetical protein